MAADVIPLDRARRARESARPRYRVALESDGRVALWLDGDVVDRFRPDQAQELAALFGAAVLLARGDADVLAGRVAVVREGPRGERRALAQLVEHRGTVVRLDLGAELPAPAWFSLADGAQVDRSAASRRWAIEEPHRVALRVRYDGGARR